MSNTYDSDERSAARCRPTDLYTIVTPSTTYRLTSNTVDVVFSSNTYTATAMGRGDQTLSQDPTGRELVVYLPISHPLVQRYAATGIPEFGVTVTYTRLMELSGAAQQQFTGPLQSMSIDGRTAMFRAPALHDDTFKIQLPVVAAQRTCNHRLGDIGCAPNPGGVYPAGSIIAGSGGPNIVALSVATTISSVSTDGLTIVIASIGGNPDGWAAFGRIILSNNDARRILTQVGTTLTLNVPFVTTTASVTIEPGCDHSVATCIAKYNNQPNFGGHPALPSSINIYAPNGLGMIQQV